MNLRYIIKEQKWTLLLEHPVIQEWFQQKGCTKDKLREMFEEEWKKSLDEKSLDKSTEIMIWS